MSCVGVRACAGLSAHPPTRSPMPAHRPASPPSPAHLQHGAHHLWKLLAQEARVGVGHLDEQLERLLRSMGC